MKRKFHCVWGVDKSYRWLWQAKLVGFYMACKNHFKSAALALTGIAMMFYAMYLVMDAATIDSYVAPIDAQQQIETEPHEVFE